MEKKMIGQDIQLIENVDGPVLGTASGKVKKVDGLYFKNLSGEEALLPYEDWRLPSEERAKDLAGRLSVEEMAGLMIYSPHQMVPFGAGGPFTAHYHGGAYDSRTMQPEDLTDEQKAFLEGDNMRHLLQFSVKDAATSAKWNNNLQKMAESLPWGIPVNISTDPRHGAGSAAAEYKSSGEDVSKWPEGLGIAATFDLDIARDYAQTASVEYRALGIATALGPQVDLATEPRWMRFEDTLGGCLEHSIELAKTICDGMQTTEGSEDGWGRDSIITMAKHWPGGGPCEGGRDAHYPFGKFAVYPGGRFEDHLKVFTEGALALDGPTKKAASIMPYYTVSYDQDLADHENVGNSYSHYIIHDLLREKYGYEGVVCTDWGITGEPEPIIDSFSQRCYGVENLSVAERHLRIIMNGVDQFGGNSDKGPIIEAYNMGCERYGKQVMDARMRESAARLLVGMFRLGLFENPYLDPQESANIVGNPEFVAKGKAAQRASIVMVKNRESILPLKKGIRIYSPEQDIKAHKGFFRMMEPGSHIVPLTDAMASGYCHLTDTPENADAAIVFVDSPMSCGYDADDLAAGGNGYVPVMLSYRPYTAEDARETSVASGDFREPGMDRGYKGKTNKAYNEADLDRILDTRQKMGDKPVIVVLRMHNPTVVSEFEPAADGILIDFGVQKDAILDVIFGDYNPGGRLPVIMPASMATVEQHCEDVFDDIQAYTDDQGNTYGYKFGLNYQGKIEE